jgi:hypothetical protein
MEQLLQSNSLHFRKECLRYAASVLDADKGVQGEQRLSGEDLRACLQDPVHLQTFEKG